MLARDPTARAGFYFTLAAMWRSNTHRLTLACAAAAGLAMAVVALSECNAQQGGGLSSRLLSMQPLLLRRAAGRLPSHHPRAGGAARQLGLSARVARPRARVPGRRQARRRRRRWCCRRCRRCCRCSCSCWARRSRWRTPRSGSPAPSCMLEALLVSYDKVPFTCTYLPSENMKALAPLYGDCVPDRRVAVRANAEHRVAKR